MFDDSNVQKVFLALNQRKKNSFFKENVKHFVTKVGQSKRKRP